MKSTFLLVDLNIEVAVEDAFVNRKVFVDVVNGIAVLVTHLQLSLIPLLGEIEDDDRVRVLLL